DQVSVGNSIGSLRFLTAMDWREFVEMHSAVEHALRGDPANVYSAMDFATRDRYRHAVEETARQCRATEHEIARQAVALAEEHRDSAPDMVLADDGRAGHVGHWLVSRGLPTLQRRVRVRPGPAVLAARLLRGAPLAFYVGAIALLTLAVSAGVLLWASSAGCAPLLVALMGLPVVVCASQLAVTIVNWLCTLLVTPHTLPRLDFSQGIPPEHRTFVVIPTMLSVAQAVDDLIESLEVRYLANRDANLHFALLTDFRDAPQEHMPTDDAILSRARAGIAALRAKYSSERDDAFFLLHRPRRWNAKEGCWMGYERKRGKLEEFNAVLRGRSADRFELVEGDTSILRSVRYVITLDTDTQLPRDAARKLVGTMAHPLNRPRFEPRRHRVVEGYGILQPRVAVSLPSASRSWFVRLFGGEPGIDPYTRTVSDVYQDAFEEGSFIGKGIYDVDAFTQSVANRFPEDRILSHDLLEGSHARSGLVSDVMLFEDHPASYSADMGRRHRWIRGDWQIAAWLLPRVPGWNRRKARNVTSGLSRWKILDNLRRSVVPIAMIVLLLLAWTAPARPWIGAVLVAAVIVAPVLLSVLVDVIRKPRDLPVRLHAHRVLACGVRHAAQAACSLTLLPYEAWMSFDAIVRTCSRMLWSRRRLLEWQTASEADHKARTDFSGMLASMWAGPLAAVVAVTELMIFQRDAWTMGTPLASLWLVSPAVAWWLSRPIPARPARLSEAHRILLRKTARQTWRFFETFITPADNHLPPDNYQEHPIEAVAHRTSPTNIGLTLLGNLCAYDFGYISTSTLLDRTHKTLTTVQKLEHFRGHLYNWYDTRSLQPLRPLYISTVDSGNLAGHALTLRAGLLQLASHPVFPPTACAGIADTLLLAMEAARGGATDSSRGPSLLGDASARGFRLVTDLASPPPTLSGTRALLQRAIQLASELLAAPTSQLGEEARNWFDALERQCRDHLDDLASLAPWVELEPAAESMWRRSASEDSTPVNSLRQALQKLDGAPTLREIGDLRQSIIPVIDQVVAAISATPLDSTWLARLRRSIVDASDRSGSRLAEAEVLAARCAQLGDPDWDFLFDRSRDLLSIGFSVADNRRDDGFYDLLASESRLASFVGIAQGKLPQEHWFALGRLLTHSGGEPALISWSGSMFEYFMPLLIMHGYPNTLLDQTYRAVIARQIEYGRQRGVPWGVSESGYNTTDAQLNYQYRAFGVPGLGFKRGLAEDLVVAPYATMLALM
ncbi:MAG: glucoamylase family protein, partial [Tepidisphaeraceae bacterium]